MEQGGRGDGTAVHAGLVTVISSLVLRNCVQVYQLWSG